MAQKKSIDLIRVEKVFVIAIILKVTSSFFGWYLPSPWIFGFIAPLTIMGLYIALGWRRTPYEISEEKFADSCYYLGFIFTITSIIFALFDLPQLQDNLGPIAIRFGAAMVSTVIGLCVRVYLVNFKKDMDEATADVESQIIDSANRFRIQLEMATEKLRALERAVFDASSTTIKRVDLAIEQSALRLSTDFLSLYEKSAEKNIEALQGFGQKFDVASANLADVVSRITNEMSSNMRLYEASLVQTLKSLEERGRKTVFPIEMITGLLEEPMLKLSVAVDETGKQIEAANADLKDKNSRVSSSFKTIEKNAEKLSTSMDGITASLAGTERNIEQREKRLAEQALLLDSLKRLADSLTSMAGTVRERVDVAIAQDGESNQRLNQIAQGIVQANREGVDSFRTAIAQFADSSRKMDLAASAVLEQVTLLATINRESKGASELESVGYIAPRQP